MKNWILNEIEKFDQEKDLIILENPFYKSIIDSVLLNNFWPFIQHILKQSNYKYYPEDDVEIFTKVKRKLEREFTFSLFDDGRSFYLGELRCSRNSWFLSSKFFFSLSRDNNIELIHELIGNSRFVGNPPTLSINKKNDKFYYEISLNNGTGLNFPKAKIIWEKFDYQKIEMEIKETIETNIKMHEMVKAGKLDKILGDFITLAYKVYEAY